MLGVQFDKDDSEMLEFLENEIENFQMFESNSFDGMTMLVTVVVSVVTEKALEKLIDLVITKKSERRLISKGSRIELDNLNESHIYNVIIQDTTINIINDNED